jgi:pimeloyl-ACP methyl ester carboxylesterase
MRGEHRRARLHGTASDWTRWLEWGEVSATRVVIALHGLGQTADFLAPLAAALVERGDVRVLAPDLRGHGESGDLVGESADACLVGDATALARTAGRPCIWFGNSLGGRVAAMAAGQHPELTARLVLAETFIGVERHLRLVLAGARARFTRSRFTSREEAHQFAATELQLRGPSHGAWLDHALAPLPDGGLGLKMRPSVLDTARWASDAAVRSLLGCIRAPVALVFGGASSALSPAQQSAAAAALPGARIARIPAAGHDVFLDAPGPLADVILDA